MAIEEPTYQNPSAEKTVDTLNSFLRGEISAIETYGQAIDKIGDPTLSGRLRVISQEHERQAAKLRNQISQLGGQPTSTSGPWGSFAKVVEGGAKVFGVKAALAALEEGEDHGLKLYRDNLEDLDATARSFVQNELLPAQQQTHDAMSALKHSMH